MMSQRQIDLLRALIGEGKTVVWINADGMQVIEGINPHPNSTPEEPLTDVAVTDDGDGIIELWCASPADFFLAERIFAPQPEGTRI